MTLEQILLILILGLIAAYILAIFLRRSKAAPNGDVSYNILLEQLDRLRKELNQSQRDHRGELQGRLDQMIAHLQKQSSSAQAVQQKQFSQTSKLIQEVTERLTTLDQTNKQVLDFSSQLKHLQSILQNPKQRGVLGEYWLESLLANVLPPDSYRMQHTLGTQEGTNLIADAVIFVRDQIIPIDAKFSLENYNRMMAEHASDKREVFERELKADVKKRIDETSKYIRPELGTMGFAFMFIPAEGVYYNLLNAKVGSTINSVNLIEYAFDRKVLIVSPTSFFAYLQTVLMGLRELQIEKSTQEILKRVAKLGKHFHQYADLHTRLGKNLQTVTNQYNQSSKELQKIDGDVHRITSGEVGGDLSIDQIEKPLIEN